MLPKLIYYDYKSKDMNNKPLHISVEGLYVVPTGLEPVTP